MEQTACDYDHKVMGLVQRGGTALERRSFRHLRCAPRFAHELGEPDERLSPAPLAPLHTTQQTTRTAAG
jgi:hypothetical protein